MWIRSQSKNTLINTDMVFVRFDRQIVAPNRESSVIVLGDYSSNERCIEILDDIHGLIQSHSTEYTSSYVYQMPENK